MSLNELMTLPDILNHVSDSAFIGRSQDVEAIRQRMLSSGCRLLTLIGPGGMGKSRLAKQVIQEIWQQYLDGVFAVWLAPLHDPQLLAQAIAESLSLQIRHDDIESELSDYLRHRKLLLYIDNFESLVDAAPLLTRLLDAAPELQILVTSRIALNLRYEWLYEVQGMPFEDTYGEAQQLFIDRARLNRDSLSESELQGIQRICDLVEGMPLAIVLAAGWLRTLPIETIADEIEQGLDLLKTRDRDWEERHRSIRTVFDSSWKLLTDNERRIMQRFSLFCGGASAEALREVTGATVDVLADLVDQSMITRDAEGRYQITELLRQYAEEQFRKSDDFADGSAAHAAYFLTRFMPQMEPQLKDRRHLDAMKRIEADFHNIDTAWTYALQNGDLDALNAAVESLHFFTEIREKYVEGSTMLRSAAECAAQIGPDSPAAARLQTRWLRFKFLRMPMEQMSLEDILASIDSLLAVFERSHDVSDQAYCWYLKGIAYAPFPPTSLIAVRDEAIQAFDRAIALFRSVGDDFYTSEALMWSGCRFENEQGIERLQQAMQIQEKLGEPNITAWTLSNLAKLLFMHHRTAQAAVYHEKAKAAMKLIDSAKGMFSAGLLGIELMILNGDYAQVTQNINELLTLVEARYPQGKKALFAIRALKRAVVENDYQAAATDAEQSRLMRTELMPISDVSAWWGIAITLCSNRDFERFRELFNKLKETGWIFEGSEAIWLMCEALSLANDCEHRRAAEYLGAAIASAEAASTSSKRWFDTWQVVDALEATLRAELGDQAYETAVDTGMELSPARLIGEMVNRQSLTHREEINRQLTDPLTERELQVLDLIRQGMSNNAIADHLVIAVETVKVHARNIYSKLGVSGRGRAVEAARQLGLI